MNTVKDKKVRLFWADTTREKPDKIMVRHFVHSKASGGLWACMRDLSQTERARNDAIGHGAAVSVTVGFHERLLALWDRLIVLDERGRSYRIAEKPDEFDYSGGDVRFTALGFDDKTVYGGDVYDDD